MSLLLQFLPEIIGVLVAVAGFFGFRWSVKRSGVKEERTRQEKIDHENAMQINARASRSDLPEQLHKFDRRGYRD